MTSVSIGTSTSQSLGVTYKHQAPSLLEADTTCKTSPLASEGTEMKSH